LDRETINVLASWHTRSIQQHWIINDLVILGFDCYLRWVIDDVFVGDSQPFEMVQAVLGDIDTEIS